jgi:chemotaxis protein MotB
MDRNTDDLPPTDLPMPADAAPSRAWMVTFTDLVSLMLTFFVLLFAMSQVKAGAWSGVIDAMSESFNPSRQPVASAPAAPYNVATTFRRRAVDLDYLSAILDQAVKADAGLAGGRVLRLEDQVVISLPGDLLFAPSGVRMSAQATDAVFRLGGTLRAIDNQIVIQGFSDPDPDIGDGVWELSVGRAMAVADVLRRSGYDSDIMVYGYGDSRYNLLPAMPEAERHAVARRVDIVVLPNSGGG